MITYEYPLIERIRTLLRLEDLFERSNHFLDKTEAPEHHVALLSLFEVVEIAGRADLKSDLLQELERQKQLIHAFRNNPQADQQAVARIVQEIEAVYAGLHGMTGRAGQHLRDNEWLMSIRQRSSIPGGVCEFDLPSYHYWLHRPSEERLEELHEWFLPLLPIRDAAQLVLKLLRESGKAALVRAQGGIFQQMLGGKTAQMVRLRVPRSVACVPEISANKYALNIRFATLGMEARTRTCEEDVDFELTFCNL